MYKVELIDGFYKVPREESMQSATEVNTYLSTKTKANFLEEIESDFAELEQKNSGEGYFDKLIAWLCCHEPLRSCFGEVNRGGCD